jgi:GT2 family glycosyltransferase
MATTHAERPAAADDVRSTSVLVVLVASNAAGWLRECLRSLAAQTHPRLGVVAVDSDSTDETPEILEQALGEGRVIHLDEDAGIAGALRAATRMPAAQAADYLLVLHDDTALQPDAVARMVDAAEGIHGVERVGIVGPKVVDWTDPRLLREVGRSTDRFGHPYTPLQDGERDQGQYDRVLEVLFVSSCAMLISRETWQRTGEFDERYGGHHDDLDFCWRARLAGFRVLMTPLAVARHRDATARGERLEDHRRRSTRYYAERAGLASMLKDYGIFTLIWLLPVYAVLGVARVAYLALSRRFEDAFDILSAWAWNLVHLPGTIGRRVRAQRVRRVRDRSVRRFMAATFRLPRWFERAEAFLDEGFEGIGGEDQEAPRLSARAVSVAAGHPVLIASVVGLGLGALAIRHLVGPEVVRGGALAAFPVGAEGFFHELLSGVRTTILGGVQAGSPALGGLGAASWLAFGNPDLAAKVLLSVLPALSGILAYRSFVRQTSRPGTAVVAAAAYVLSAVSLWAFSEGRLGMLVGLAAMPVVWDRLDGAFARRRPERPFRFGVSLGVAAAIALSFEPGLALPIALAGAAHVIEGRRRARGVGLIVLGAVAAAGLAFPVVLDVAGHPASLGSGIGTTDPWSILRFAPGATPGSWGLAAFLPVAAVLCFAAVGRQDRGRAWRAMTVAVGAAGLAWVSAAGYLPEAVSNAPAYLVGAAFAAAAVVAYGAPGLVSGLERQAFGIRQIGAALLTIVLGVGIGSQALQIALAEWDVRPSGLPPAWPVIDTSAPGEFRILWIGRPSGERFAAPGGDPLGIVEAGAASVRYAITDRDGIVALDVGRAAHGPGYEYLRRALGEILAGDTSHAGALLGPLGVRFVVASDGDLPEATRTRLDAQLDLDPNPAGGLTIYRNAAALPTAFVGPVGTWPDAEEDANLPAIAARALVPVERVPPPEELRGYDVDVAGQLVIGDQRSAGWRVSNGDGAQTPRPAFGWAMAADVEPGAVTLEDRDQFARTVEVAVLGFLWLAALWITRKPGSA